MAVADFECLILDFPKSSLQNLPEAETNRAYESWMTKKNVEICASQLFSFGLKKKELRKGTQ